MNQYVQDVRLLLEERSKEVDRHLEFAKFLIDSRANGLAMYFDGDIRKSFPYVIDRSLVKTIRATGYLLIYNLIESVMTASLDAVHLQLKDESLTFSELSKKMKEICYDNFKKSISEQKISENSELLIDDALVWLGYHRNKHWNGNVDVKSIEAKTKKYGIQVIYTENDQRELKENFLDIRRKRNSLSHGELSFEQCGQDTAIESLIEYNRQAFRYLSVVIDGVERYLLEKKYLAAS